MLRCSTCRAYRELPKQRMWYSHNQRRQQQQQQQQQQSSRLMNRCEYFQKLRWLQTTEVYRWKIWSERSRTISWPNSPAKQRCDLTYNLTTTNPHSLAKQYIQNIAIKINRMDNTANDESIMAIIQALLKAILKKYHPFKSLLQLHPSCLTLSQESRVTFQLQLKLELSDAMCTKAH